MLPIYDIILGNADGVQIMSLVEYPAVESDFLAFEKQEPMKFMFDDEQHIVFGCALRANYPIYRFDNRRGEYYVRFSPETIKDLYEKFMIEKRVDTVNLDHNTMIEGVHLIQSFIKDTEKGIDPIGFEDVSNGSWFTAYKILNDEVWDRVKAGEFRGFSVEGYFELEEPDEPKDAIEELIDEILN